MLPASMPPATLSARIANSLSMPTVPIRASRRLPWLRSFAESDVSWFEEPVSSDDLEGLRLMRDRAPPGMDISAGEYGYDSGYFRRMLQAGAVDVLQADATRCAGITGFMQAAALCQAFHLPLSSHCAPSIHVHPCCAQRRCATWNIFTIMSG